MDAAQGGVTGSRGHRPTPHARRGRLLWLGTGLLACALGSVPAAGAQSALTPVTLPPLGEVREEAPLPDPPPTPTTAPAAGAQAPPTTTPKTAPAARPGAPAPAPTTEAPRSNRRPRLTTRPRRAAAPEQPPPTTLVDTSHPVDREGRALERLRDASLPAARQFGFPLGLGLVVLGFLALQGRLDGRDPRLAAAPISMRDDLLPFT